MAHPRCRDSSGLRRTPALVGLHHCLSARRPRLAESRHRAREPDSRLMPTRYHLCTLVGPSETPEPPETYGISAVGAPHSGCPPQTQKRTRAFEAETRRFCPSAICTRRFRTTLPSLRTTAVPASHTAARHRYPAAAVATQHPPPRAVHAGAATPGARRGAPRVRFQANKSMRHGVHNGPEPPFSPSLVHRPPKCKLTSGRARGWGAAGPGTAICWPLVHQAGPLLE
jgi:hypothetical protein